MSNRNWHISVANYGMLIMTISYTQSSLKSLFTSFCPIHSVWPVSERKIAPLLPPIIALTLSRFLSLLPFHCSSSAHTLWFNRILSHSHSMHLILYHSMNFALSLAISPYQYYSLFFFLIRVLILFLFLFQSIFSRCGFCSVRGLMW